MRSSEKGNESREKKSTVVLVVPNYSASRWTKHPGEVSALGLILSVTTVACKSSHNQHSRVKTMAALGFNILISHLK